MKCYNCENKSIEGTVYMAGDKSFCSRDCRKCYKLYTNDINLPALYILESTPIIYPMPRFNTSLSIKNGLDNMNSTYVENKQEFTYVHESDKVVTESTSCEYNNYNGFYYTTDLIYNCFTRKTIFINFATLISKALF